MGLYYMLKHKFVTVTSKRDGLVALASLIPTYLLFALVVVVPALWAVWSSFYDITLFGSSSGFIALGNYVSVLESGRFWNSLFRGLAYAVSTTAIQIVLGIAIALLINRKIKGISLIRTFVIFPWMLPTIVVTMMFFLMGTRYGILSDVLLRLGVIDQPTNFFATFPEAFVGVMLVSVWKFVVFVVFLVLARLQTIPESRYEAARLAGASAWEQFRDVTWPAIRGVVFIVLLLRGIWMFNKFDVIWLLTEGGPGRATETFPIYAFRIGFVRNNMGEAAALSVIGFLILATVGVVYFRVFEPTKGMVS